MNAGDIPGWAAALLSAIFAAGGAYGATRIELRFLWRDVNRLGRRVLKLEGARPSRRWDDEE